LGSESKHFPYGELNGTPTPDTEDHFATYRRDDTNLDYAMNRYYSPAMGRFTTPDPYGGSAKVGMPESWNRYAYVGNDPVNFGDSSGLTRERTFSITVTEALYPLSEGPIHICNMQPWFCLDDIGY
jgi:RHS repeat-associated protein